MPKFSFPRMAVVALAIVATSVLAATSAVGRTAPRAHAAYKQLCSDPYSGTRDPANPLMLATAPGSNPIRGAQFYVAGPAKGPAAQAIAQLLGLNPAKYALNYSWARFAGDLTRNPLLAKLNANAGLAHNVAELSKIASGPETNRLSSFTAHGSPSGIFAQANRILCNNLAADPGTIPLLSTYFLHPSVPTCPTPGEVAAAKPTFEARVNAVADAIAHRPAVMLVETDAIGTSRCITKDGVMPQWEADLRYELSAYEALPHTVVYVEGGYSDSNSPSYTARVLNAIGITHIAGFWTNDTHSQWTINEIHWGDRVSNLTHGAHFVINTAGNGRGPLLNKHPKSQGIENLCNAPGRGLGPRTTTSTGFAHVDAYLWSSVPGASSGRCNGGTAAGTFWVAGAIGLASRAQGKLGPGYPTDPY